MRRIEHYRVLKTLRRVCLLGAGSLLIACATGNCGRTAQKIPDGAAAEKREAKPDATVTSAGSNSAAGARTTRRIALLVGINDYKQDFDDLQGCVNDTENMLDVLTKSYGVADSDVVLLRDKEATLQGIKRAFTDHLIANAREDTSVIFYFSGHGSQMHDASGDEPDGLDETLVTYDSGRGSHENRDLSDDALNGLLTQLGKRTKHITLIIDACHSGTVTRAAGKPRAAPPDCRTAPSGRCAASNAARGGENAGLQDSTLAYTLISGARTNEYSYEQIIEGDTHGALTWFLTHALRSAAGNDTYRDLMDRVRSQVTAIFPTQHPQLEGIGQDDVVFGVERRPAEPYVDAWKQENVLMLAAGSAHGVTTGSKFALYPEGTKEFAVGRELGQAQATKVAGTTAEMAAESAGLPERLRAVERKRALGTRRLRVRFVGDTDSVRKVRSSLRAYDHITEAPGVQQYDVLLASTGHGAHETLRLEGGSARPIAVPVKRGEESTAVTQILGWAKWHALAAIENDKSPLRSEFTYTISLPDRPSEPRASEGLDTRVQAGKEFEVKLQNKGSRALHLHLLALSADGSVNVVYPPPGASERIEPGSTWKERIRTCLPAGRQESIRDILKLFVTVEATDFSFLRQAPITRSARGKMAPRSDQDPLSALLASSTLGMRGLERDRADLAPDDWATYQRSLEVLPVAGAKPCR